MVYKFNDEKQTCQMEVGYNDSTPHVFIELTFSEMSIEYNLNKNQLYDLIGALHSLQSKLKKEL